MKHKAKSIGPVTHIPIVDTGGLLRRIKAYFGGTYDRLERYSGRSRSTLHHWAESRKPDQIEALFLLLARIPLPERREIIESAMPFYPALEHPYIARQKFAAIELRRLLTKTAGATFVRSSSEYAATFVATAMAHSFAAQRPEAIVVSGVDVHACDWLVGVDGVNYLELARKKGSLQSVIRNAWTEVTPKPLVFANGIYGVCPDVDRSLERMSAKSHVVIVTPNVGNGRATAKFHPDVHVVSVTVENSDPLRGDDAAYLQIDVRTV